MVPLEQTEACFVSFFALIFGSLSYFRVLADAVPAPHSRGGSEIQIDVPSQFLKRWTGEDAIRKGEIEALP